jgi:site-specific recombinase XerD
VRKTLDTTEKRDLENSTINNMRGTFSMIYRHGRRKNLVEVNPAADVPLREVGNWKERFLSAEEEKRLREVLQRHIDSHDPPFTPNYANRQFIACSGSRSR